MNCQQLTAVCIFMTTCQIASGQLSFFQRLALPRNYPNSLVNRGVLRRPPPGYHYETMRHILNTYPRNSYTIKYGLSNIVGSNNNGGSASSKGGQKNSKKSKKKNKSEDEDDDTSSPATDTPTDGLSTETPSTGTPPDATPPPPTATP